MIGQSQHEVYTSLTELGIIPMYLVYLCHRITQ